jgi:hypothetical protein
MDLMKYLARVRDGRLADQPSGEGWTVDGSMTMDSLNYTADGATL